MGWQQREFWYEHLDGLMGWACELLAQNEFLWQLSLENPLLGVVWGVSIWYLWSLIAPTR